MNNTTTGISVDYPSENDERIGKKRLNKKNLHKRNVKKRDDFSITAAVTVKIHPQSCIENIFTSTAQSWRRKSRQNDIKGEICTIENSPDKKVTNPNLKVTELNSVSKNGTPKSDEVKATKLNFCDILIREEKDRSKEDNKHRTGEDSKILVNEEKDCSKMINKTRSVETLVVTKEGSSVDISSCPNDRNAKKSTLTEKRNPTPKRSRASPANRINLKGCEVKAKTIKICSEAEIAQDGNGFVLKSNLSHKRQKKEGELNLNLKRTVVNTSGSSKHKKGESEKGDNLVSTKRKADESDNTVVLKMMNEYGLNVVFLPAGKTCRLINLKKCYAKTFGIPIHSLRFFFDGERLNDWDTPQDMEMDNGDVIEVFRDFDAQDLSCKSSSNSGCVSSAGSDQSRAEALFDDLTRVIKLESSDEENEYIEHDVSDGEEQAYSHLFENVVSIENVVFIEIETMVASDSQCKEITQIGGFKENSDCNSAQRFFKAIKPKKLEYYLDNFKCGGDLLQTLHIQKNERGQFEFRNQFEIMNNRTAIKCVSEEEAFEELSNFLASVKNCIIFSLSEANIELLTQRMKFLGASNTKINFDSVKGFCSWSSFMKEAEGSSEELDQDFEEWYDNHVKISSSYDSPEKHAEVVAKMVRDGVNRIRTFKGFDANVTKHLAKASQPIKSLLSKLVPEEVEKSNSDTTYLELFSSLRPNFPVTVSLKKMETYNIFSDDEDGDTNEQVGQIEVFKKAEKEHVKTDEKAEKEHVKTDKKTEKEHVKPLKNCSNTFVPLVDMCQAEVWQEVVPCNQDVKPLNSDQKGLSYLSLPLANHSNGSLANHSSESLANHSNVSQSKLNIQYTQANISQSSAMSTLTQIKPTSAQESEYFNPPRNMYTGYVDPFWGYANQIVSKNGFDYCHSERNFHRDRYGFFPRKF